MNIEFEEMKKLSDPLLELIPKIRTLIQTGYNPGIIFCPYCNNFMDFGTAKDYNNHLHVICRTKDCCWFVE